MTNIWWVENGSIERPYKITCRVGAHTFNVGEVWPIDGIANSGRGYTAKLRTGKPTIFKTLEDAKAYIEKAATKQTEPVAEPMADHPELRASLEARGVTVL